MASKAKLRFKLAERDGPNCHICGGLMNFDRPRRKTGATVDHVIPRSQGGSNDISNLKLAHKRCNEARGDTPLGKIA